MGVARIYNWEVLVCRMPKLIDLILGSSHTVTVHAVYTLYNELIFSLWGVITLRISLATPMRQLQHNFS